MDSLSMSGIFNSDEPEAIQIGCQTTDPLHPECAAHEVQSPEFVLKPEKTSIENESTGCETLMPSELDSALPPPPSLPPQIECQITDPLHPEWAAHEVQSLQFVLKPEETSLENESIGCETLKPPELDSLPQPPPPPQIRCQITDPLHPECAVQEVQSPEFVLEPEKTSLENESIGCETLKTPELDSPPPPAPAPPPTLPLQIGCQMPDPLHLECAAQEVKSPEFVLEPEKTSLENESIGCGTPNPSELDSPLSPQIGCEITDPLHPECAGHEVQSPEFVLKPDKTSLENESTGCETLKPSELDSPLPPPPPLPPQIGCQITNPLHRECAAHEVQSPKFVLEPQMASLENESIGCGTPNPSELDSPLSPQIGCEITDPLHPKCAGHEVQIPEFVLKPDKTSLENESTGCETPKSSELDSLLAPPPPLPPQIGCQITDSFLKRVASEVQSPEFVLEPEMASFENESIGHEMLKTPEIDLSLPLPLLLPPPLSSPPPPPSSPPQPPPPPPLSPRFYFRDELLKSPIPEMEASRNESMNQTLPKNDQLQEDADDPQNPQLHISHQPHQTDSVGNMALMQISSNQSEQEMDSPVNHQTMVEPPLKRSREEHETFNQSPSFTYSDGDLMEMSDEEILGQSVTEIGTPVNETSDSAQQETASLSDMGQMVCGHCQELLSYPRGVVHVQCSWCQTVNLVLESCQVGTVNCMQCSVLLMYPFGAPSVRCFSCLYVTEIGAHNLGPPLSVQLGENFPTSEFESTNAC